MTDATVDAFVGDVKGRTIKVKCPDGEKVIKVAENVPVMRMGLNGKRFLKPGSNASARARKGKGGAITAVRVLVGKDGFVPPLWELENTWTFVRRKVGHNKLRRNDLV
ncbi:hypothetical protein ACFLQ0_02845 [Nitrospinota bacterium]